MTALETAHAVRTGALSALEACDAAIARIEARDGPINAVVVRDFDRARAAAKALDRGGAKGDSRPLIGVPMTIKESHDIEGLPTTWGFPGFRDFMPERDGLVARRLKNAGAVLLGKSNVPMALADWQSVNEVYGRTHNPHDHARSPGGSSGGSAAALAAGMVPLEVGSDIGGSIRVPAHFCGVFGHKSTYGIIPMQGHAFPGTSGADRPMSVLGPMARSADDLIAALELLAGPIETSPYRLSLPPPRAEHMRDVRIVVLDAHPVARIGADVHDAIHKLADAACEEGAQIVRDVEDLPDLADAHANYVRMLNTAMTRGAPGATPVDAHVWMGLLDAQFALQRRWARVFEQTDVVLAPVFGLPAFEHKTEPEWKDRSLTIDGEETAYGAQLAWAGLASFSGLPATVAPVAKSKEGLPIGVQILADLYQDNTALAFARALERAGLTV
ncbi:MAG: amidase [Alphaproteobacteria bacterium]|nr:amidase [Alphaproteobacteria bacterium]